VLGGELNTLRIGTGMAVDGLHKKEVNLLLAEQISASQEGLCGM
jgi:hypothetical protein